ncbi:MAG: GatB/YqeY domain-containing protein [Chloroflexi bacterium]|nr:GatB/YqeY domain-containing protein [Chloroflexota bacterium]
MTDLRTALTAALKEAMLAKDNLRRDVVRGLQSAIKQVEIDTRKSLSDDEILAVVIKEAKKRRETIEEATKAHRDDLVAAESAELAVIETFMPRQLSLDELKRIAAEVIAQVGASGPKDQSKVMGPIMARVKGQADGKLVNQAVRELLNG